LDKHFSLFSLLINDKEKGLIALAPGDNVTKRFSSSPTMRQNKLEHLALTMISQLMSETGAYPNGTPSDTLLALPTKYLLSLERFVRTNTLAYFLSSSMTKKKVLKH
jgi:hypothetical protein